MDLDLVTLGVFLGSFCLCAGLVGVVSLLGAKEKTFEEAIEEQKRKNQQQNKAKGHKKAEANKAKDQRKKRTQDNKITEPLPASSEGTSEAKNEATKKRKRGYKKGQQQPVAQTTSEDTKEEMELPMASVPVEENFQISSSNNVLEIHRQYLQDDVADTVETPTSVTPEPPVKETLNLIKESVPEESTPASTPEPPAPSKNGGPAKGGKKKMVIEEVVEKTDLNEQRSSLSPQPTSGKGGKKNKKPEVIIDAPEVSKNAKLSPRELIASVKKTSLDDSECQQLIEVLLNKQVGAGAVNGDWVDTGNKGQQNEIKSLQKQLSEKSSALDEEVARNKSITDRMNLLRQELNQAKSQSVSAQRVLDEVQGRNQHELSNIQARLQAEAESHQRDVAHLQSQLQYQIGHAGGLQVTVDQLQNQLLEAQSHAAVDPAIYSELENLRGTKAALEAELAGLREQLSKQLSDNSSKDKLLSLENEKEKVSQQLSKVQNDNKALQDKVKKLETGQKDDLSRLKEELAESNSRNTHMEGNVKRLSDENERLAEQLASNVERPKVEGQEQDAGGKVTNGVEEGIKFKKTIQALEEEKEEITKQSHSQVVKLQTDIQTYQVQVKEIQQELDAQKQKNNDLAKESGKKSESESAQKALLERLFPDIKVGGSKSHESWLELFATEVKAKQSSSPASQGNLQRKLESLKKDKKEEADKLEKQVSHYKMVLAQTENMLNELQSSVESEEKYWKDLASKKDIEVNRLKGEKEELEKKNSGLQESLAVVKQAEEMQEKLQELQSKLTEEESEKNDLFKKYSEAQKQLKENNSLKEEVERLQSRLLSEESKNSTLGDKVAKMSQVVTSGQEALSKELKTAGLLAAEGKKDSDENGPSNDQETPKTPSTSSQMGSVGSLDSTDSNTPKKVTKKKKILGLFK